MPTFEFVCHQCDTDWDLYLSFADSEALQRCPDCRSPLVKQYSVPQIKLGLRPHWDYQLGEYISSEAQRDSVLHRKSDEQSERTGIPHDYKMVDRDASAGTGDVEQHMRAKTDAGYRDPQHYM